VYKEIEIMKQVEHPNIIRLHEVIDDPVSDKLYLVLPLAEYGECMTWNSEEFAFMPNPKLINHPMKKIVKLNAEEFQYYTEE